MAESRLPCAPVALVRAGGTPEEPARVLGRRRSATGCVGRVVVKVVARIV